MWQTTQSVYRSSSVPTLTHMKLPKTPMLLLFLLIGMNLRFVESAYISVSGSICVLLKSCLIICLKSCLVEYKCYDVCMKAVCKVLHRLLDLWLALLWGYYTIMLVLGSNLLTFCRVAWKGKEEKEDLDTAWLGHKEGI